MNHRPAIKNSKKNLYNHRDNKYFLKQAKQAVDKQKIVAASWTPFFSKKRKIARQEQSSPITLHVEFDSEYFCVTNWKFKTTTQKLLGFLLLIQMIIPAASDTIRHKVIHDMPVEDFIPNEFSCRDKTTGISQGKICEKNNITYFMKNLNASDHTKASLEAFNRQFVKDNIGIKTPKTMFFYDKTSKQYSIASEKIEGFAPAYNFFSAISKNADFPYANHARRDVAKLAVAMTFIEDLHNENWGMDKSSITLVDVDSIGDNLPKFLDYYLLAAGLTERLKDSGFYELSLANIFQMQNIYKEMQRKPLPKFHDICQLSHDKYILLLKTFVKACEQTIANIKSKHPKLGLYDLSAFVLKELSFAFRKIKDDYPFCTTSRKNPGASACA